MSSKPPSGTGRQPRPAAAVAAAPDAPLNLPNLRMKFQHLSQSAPLVPPFFTTKTGASPSLSFTCTVSYRFSASKCAAQRAQNRRQKHVCFYLFSAFGRPVFLFEETDFLCKTQIDPS